MRLTTWTWIFFSICQDGERNRKINRKGTSSMCEFSYTYFIDCIFVRLPFWFFFSFISFKMEASFNTLNSNFISLHLLLVYKNAFLSHFYVYCSIYLFSHSNNLFISHQITGISLVKVNQFANCEKIQLKTSGIIKTQTAPIRQRSIVCAINSGIEQSVVSRELNRN